MSNDPGVYRDADLYRDSARIPLSVAISRRARLRVHDIFMRVIAPSQSTSIIDIGVSDENSSNETNMLERCHPWPESLTCVGIHEGQGFRGAFPQHSYIRIVAGKPLPFADYSFDVAYSNAVIEHVGSDQMQREFVAELQRIARRAFIVAPNRLFPIEHHTGLPLLHWLPLAVFRKLIYKTRFAFWAKEENLNIITRSKLVSLFPPGVRPTVLHAGVGLGRFRSNLVAYT